MEGDIENNLNVTCVMQVMLATRGGIKALTNTRMRLPPSESISVWNILMCPMILRGNAFRWRKTHSCVRQRFDAAACSQHNLHHTGHIYIVFNVSLHRKAFPFGTFLCAQ